MIDHNIELFNLYVMMLEEQGKLFEIVKSGDNYKITIEYTGMYTGLRKNYTLVLKPRGSNEKWIEDHI